MTSREIVFAALNFTNPCRVPRQLWTLPWTEKKYPEDLKSIQADFPDDIIAAPSTVPLAAEGFSIAPPVTEGDPYKEGQYIDPWGCKFVNLQNGVIGEARDWRVKNEDWEDVGNIRIPEEAIEIDIQSINSFCKNTDKFVTMGDNVRPFERLQFIRGTEALFVDLLLLPPKMLSFIEELHDFYCRLLRQWAKTDVDALLFMDDWGSQDSLLINPDLWLKLFKPLYRDYINIAHQNNKKIFMHSDGNITAIIPHLIDLGLDAINSQIFCMDLKTLEDFKGKITFWGEIDRQHLLVEGSRQEIIDAVTGVKNSLWNRGGCIAQCEFGPGAKPENVRSVFETWNSFTDQL